MITWSITSLDSIPSSGVVVSAKWKCLNEQDELSAVREGISVFPEPNENIIPYDSLTEQDVLNWVWSDGGVDKTIVEESVIQELNNKLNPTIVQKQPNWVK